MALAYLTINLDAFTGDDHPPVPSYSTITLDPGADHIDAAAGVIHVRTIVVSLDRQGKAATANGVPCVDGRVPVVAGVAYAVSAPNILRGGPHYIPALTAGQVVDLSGYITPGAPVTPDQAAALTARIVALEEAPPGITDHGALTGLGDDDHPHYLTNARGDARYVSTTDPRLSDARTPTAHTHPASQVSDSTATGRALLTAVDSAAARTAIGAGTSSLAIGTTGTTAAAGNRAATETATGMVELATTTETTTGTDTVRAVTPAGVKAVADTKAPASHTHAAGDIISGVLAPARLGTGTASASTVLYGDGAWKAAPSGSGSGLSGTGSPEGVVTATPGTEYTDTAGTNGAWRWLKVSGTGNTGWVVTYGDTGWRALPQGIGGATARYNNGVGTGFWIRRTGDVVAIHAPSLLVTTSGTGLGSFCWDASGAGFRPIDYCVFLPRSSGPVQRDWDSAGWPVFTADNHLRGTTLFLTRAAWPTALPGTPA